MDLPPLGEILADAHVLTLPMRVKFRGITAREVMVIHGPAGWGEFSPFTEYGDEESAPWLRSAIESAWIGPPLQARERVRVNATVPAVDASAVGAVMVRFPGCDTAKVKVAEKGQSLSDDVQRVNAVRALVPHVRVDANGGWSVDDAVTALAALTADGPLEYAEQPCATVGELVQVRERVLALGLGVRIAADESIRKAEDPMKVVRAGGCDVAVLKVAPLGGMRAVLELAGELGEYGVPVVISSALDSAVGMAAGLAAAAAIPHLEFACGLGTGRLFEADVVPGRDMIDGMLDASPVEPDPALLASLRSPEDVVTWWKDRARRCHALLE